MFCLWIVCYIKKILSQENGQYLVNHKLHALIKDWKHLIFQNNIKPTITSGLCDSKLKILISQLLAFCLADTLSH